MLQRALGQINGASGPVTAGNRLFDGRALYAVNGDAQAIPVAALIAGIVNRTGSTGATADSLPTVDSIVAALPQISRGDSILFHIRMPDANAITLTAGTGMTGVGTINVAASNIRSYLLTMTSGPSRTAIYAGTTTNASAVITNLTATQIQSLSIGMAVTGTGVGAAAKIIAINANNNTITLSAVSTATADNIALTFTPQADLLGFGTQAI